ncbi:MAG: transposase [Kofleriaceae bacterium]
MALYSVRADRQFCEQLDYNLLCRWFLDMRADEPTFDASSFSRNRDRRPHWSRLRSNSCPLLRALGGSVVR